MKRWWIRNGDLLVIFSLGNTLIVKKINFQWGKFSGREQLQSSANPCECELADVIFQLPMQTSLPLILLRFDFRGNQLEIQIKQYFYGSQLISTKTTEQDYLPSPQKMKNWHHLTFPLLMAMNDPIRLFIDIVQLPSLAVAFFETDRTSYKSVVLKSFLHNSKSPGIIQLWRVLFWWRCNQREVTHFFILWKTITVINSANFHKNEQSPLILT